ncbi:MAG: hypothetical protein EXS32_02300 [Opitutus sp.]|nr:hypothetical protein [Opitutus sp.]
MPAFTATIVKLSVLRSVLVPPKIVAALGGGTHIPVVARYADAATVSTLNPAGGHRRRLVLQMDVLRPAKLDTGDRIKIELTLDRSSRHQALPVDLQRALQFRPAAAAALERASPSTRRIVVELLEESRTPETRARRLEKLIERLAENSPRRATKI